MDPPKEHDRTKFLLQLAVPVLAIGIAWGEQRYRAEQTDKALDSLALQIGTIRKDIRHLREQGIAFMKDIEQLKERGR